MEIRLTLALPRDQMSVPVVRRVLKSSMITLGVEEEVTSDIELALTEACTNVLNHAGDADDYEVVVGIDGQTCIIEVVDRGSGFDGSEHGHEDADHSAEQGRGIQLMRALVDRVTFSSQPRAGTVVHLEKKLTWSTQAKERHIDELLESGGDQPS